MKLVQVNWIDAVTDDHGWRAIEDVRKTEPHHCRSVGWVIKHTKNKITLVSCIGGNDCDGDITIPMCMVKEIIPLIQKR